MPHRRKWEHTEYGRAWYETIQQPDKLQKTQSEASKSAASNKQHHIREFTFKLSTYNLLAPNLLEDNIYLYERINPLYLDWNYRKRKIMEEIESIDSDVKVVLLTRTKKLDIKPYRKLSRFGVFKRWKRINIFNISCLN